MRDIAYGTKQYKAAPTEVKHGPFLGKIEVKSFSSHLFCYISSNSFFPFSRNLSLKKWIAQLSWNEGKMSLKFILIR